MLVADHRRSCELSVLDQAPLASAVSLAEELRLKSDSVESCDSTLDKDWFRRLTSTEVRASASDAELLTDDDRRPLLLLCCFIWIRICRVIISLRGAAYGH
jgi:hypothetical protein